VPGPASCPPAPRTTARLAQRWPFPEFGLIQGVVNAGFSNYHSLAFKVTRRYANGLTVLSGYTFSKSIDNGSGVRTLGSDPLFPQNAYCLSCERGRSVFDQKHRFVTSVVYALPFGKGRPYLNRGLASHVIGGWDLNSIFTLARGFPLTVVPGSDRSQTSTGYDRTNATGISPKLDNPTPNEWFNIAAFSQQPLNTYGNAGRNSFRSMTFNQLDLGLHKSFRLWNEHSSFDLRGEAFNVLNKVNYMAPNSNRSSGSYGSITSAFPPRQLQVAGKLSF